MTFGEKLKEERKAGHDEGYAEGRSEIRMLSTAMKNDGRREEFYDAIEDEAGAALDALLIEYGIMQPEE